MKKGYVMPRIKAVDIESDEHLLQSSYMDIGGNTDRFNAPRRGYRTVWDEDEEE